MASFNKRARARSHKTEQGPPRPTVYFGRCGLVPRSASAHARGDCQNARRSSSSTPTRRSDLVASKKIQSRKSSIRDHQKVTGSKIKRPGTRGSVKATTKNWTHTNVSSSIVVPIPLDLLVQDRLLPLHFSLASCGLAPPHLAIIVFGLFHSPWGHRVPREMPAGGVSSGRNGCKTTDHVFAQTQLFDSHPFSLCLSLSRLRRLQLHTRVCGGASTSRVQEKWVVISRRASNNRLALILPA